jgi:hypothetical protein
MPIVDLIFEDSCPNVDTARAHLREALLALRLAPAWSEHRIGDTASPARVHGYGSPTILVDGRDVAGEQPASDACCRLYGAGQGAPPVDVIARALRGGS